LFIEGVAGRSGAIFSLKECSHVETCHHLRRVPNEAMFVKPYGAVGQVEPIFCNIRDDASVQSVMRGSDAVVNCVGVLDNIGKNTFEAVQAEGAERITKAVGEAGVLAHMPDAMILRPSIVFGSEDGFFNRFASMTRFGPVLPIVGADTKFQPVYVDDVAAAAVIGVNGAGRGVYELGGPDVRTFRELMGEMLTVIRRRRLVLNIPFWAARIMALGFKFGSTLSLGLVRGPVTVDQVKNLAVDNVVADDAQGFDALGLTPTAMEAILPDYLWRFRPSGQYAAIKESAKNLKA